MKLSPRQIAGLLICCSFFFPTSVRADTEIVTCGQVYTGAGYLSGNLDCTGFAGSSVTIDGGSLDLRGFTLTAGTFAAVYCSRGCTVTSSVAGGTIAGETTGVFFLRRAKIQGITVDGPEFGVRAGDGERDSAKVSDCTILSPTFAVFVPNGLFSMRNCTVNGDTYAYARTNIRDSGIVGSVEVLGKVAVRRSSVTGGDSSGLIFSTSAIVIDSVVSGHTKSGVYGGVYGRVRVKRSEISGNGEFGIFGQDNTSIKLVDATVRNNGSDGVSGYGPVKFLRSNVTDNGRDGVHVIGPLRVTASTVTGNGRDGVYLPYYLFGTCRSLTLAGSSVVANGTGASCGVTETCADLASCGPPGLTPDSFCDTSYQMDSGFPGTSWGVCALD